MNEKRRYNSLTVDIDRLEEICRNVLNMHKEGVFPFDRGIEFPDAIVPEGITVGSLEHSLFLFHSCSLDQRRRSDLVYEGFRKMLKEGMDVLRLADYTMSELESFFIQGFRSAGIGGQKSDPWEIVSDNAQKLKSEQSSHNFSSGDPRKIRRETVEETINELRNYIGIGEGISRLIIKNYVRFGIWDFPLNQIIPKVDRHIKKIALGTGIVKLEEPQLSIPHGLLDRPLYEGLKQVLEINSNWSGIDLDDAFYLLGSKRCVLDDKFHCKDCYINCATRPYLDASATRYYPKKETRDTRNSLF